MIRRKLYLRFIGVIVCVTLLWIYVPSYVSLNHQQHRKHSEQKSNSSVDDLFDFNLLRDVIKSNDEQHLDEHKFNPLTDDNLVIIVQVHKRLKYLQNLIDSLSKVKFIEETLIIFSHDLMDEEINNSIRRIDFAKIKQIFFPFSTQIWHNTFPGQSFNDCPRDIGKKKALEINCDNADQPDSYGHYRESNVTQTKHHWWWKLWYVMEHLPQTKKHHGDFLFIEEDHYVSPDLIHRWKLMKLSRKDLKESDTVVDILTMGNYEFNVQKPIKNIQAEMKKLNLTNWFSSKHNMAFTIDRALWSRIKSCQFEFCSFDDYNWDWSLQHIINVCLKQKLRTLVTVVPRVFHAGTCGGLHHKKKQCDENSEANKLKKFFEKNHEYQFIDEVRIEKHTSGYKRIINNGGWSDRRDHQLCQQYQLPVLQIFHRNQYFYKLLENNLYKLDKKI